MKNYSSARQRAWRNLMVATINEALARGLITLDGDKEPASIFDFDVEGMPARGFTHDAGWREVGVSGALYPREGGPIRSSNAGFYAGEAFATGWLERKTGAWLQKSHPLLNCRRHLIDKLAALKVEPQGYADRGKFFL